MNKNAFMSEFSRKLRRLPKEDYDDAMRYYSEFFMDSGIDDQTDVIPIVGTVDEVSARILEELTDKQIDKTVKEGGAKNSSRAIWYIILGIFAAPIAFPMAMVIAILFFVFIIVVFTVLIALMASSIAVVFAGLAAIPAIFWAETSSQVLVLIGMACVAIAVGSLLCYGVFKLAKSVVKGILSSSRNFAAKHKKTNSSNVSNTTYFNSEEDLTNNNSENIGLQSQEEN